MDLYIPIISDISLAVLCILPMFYMHYRFQNINFQEKEAYTKFTSSFSYVAFILGFQLTRWGEMFSLYLLVLALLYIPILIFLCSIIKIYSNQQEKTNLYIAGITKKQLAILLSFFISCSTLIVYNVQFLQTKNLVRDYEKFVEGLINSEDPTTYIMIHTKQPYHFLDFIDNPHLLKDSGYQIGNMLPWKMSIILNVETSTSSKIRDIDFYKVYGSWQPHSISRSSIFRY